MTTYVSWRLLAYLGEEGVEAGPDLSAEGLRFRAMSAESVGRTVGLDGCGTWAGDVG